MSDDLEYVEGSFTIETVSYGTVPEVLYDVYFDTEDGYLFQAASLAARTDQSPQQNVQDALGETAAITYQATAIDTANAENGEGNYVTSFYSTLGSSEWMENWTMGIVSVGIKTPADSSILKLLPEAGGPGAVVMTVAGLTLVAYTGLLVAHAHRQGG